MNNPLILNEEEVKQLEAIGGVVTNYDNIEFKTNNMYAKEKTSYSKAFKSGIIFERQRITEAVNKVNKLNLLDASNNVRSGFVKLSDIISIINNETN